MTAKGTTKQGILDAALELFSVQGYEATSISQLAEAVGIRKASLYSHFENKQAILDALIQTTIGEYEKHSIFANADWDDPAFAKDKEHMTAEMAAQMFLGQIRYILHDPKISRARKMLTIEQFQNPQMAALQTKQNYTDVMGYFTGLVRFLIRQGRRCPPYRWPPPLPGPPGAACAGRWRRCPDRFPSSEHLQYAAGAVADAVFL